MKTQQSKKLVKEERLEAAPSAPTRTPIWLHAAVLLGLFAVNLALYYRALDLGFLSLDDPDYIQNNPLLGNDGRINFRGILTEPYFANYAPLTLLSYALDISLGGGKGPFAIHLSNVLWQGWVIWTVYLLAFTIRPSVLTAAAAAWLFLLHPGHVEVAAWISCRKDLLATGFAGLSMSCYLLSRRSSLRKAWWYAGSLLCFLLASAAKQSVLLLPLLMIAWDLLVEGRRSWLLLADKIPFGIITFFFGWMTWTAQPSTNHAWHLFVPAATEFVNLWLLTGFGKYVLYRVAPDPAVWGAVSRAFVIIAAVAVWAVPFLILKLLKVRPAFTGTPGEAKGNKSGARSNVRVERNSLSTWNDQTSTVLICAVLFFWALIQMIPPMLLNFIVPITDRYLFLPSVGICIMLAIVATALTTARPRTAWVAWGALGVVAATWGAKTSVYLDEWGDPRSVWYGAHFKTKNPQVFQFLGEIYQNAGERIDNFVKSGTSLEMTNELRLAQAVLGDSARAQELRAEWVGQISTRTNSAAYRDRLWNLASEQLGEALSRRGNLSAPNLFMNRGRLLVRQGKAEQAIAEFKNALALAQTSTYEMVRQETVTHAQFAIGVAYWNLGKYQDAQEWLLKAQETQRKSGRVWLPNLDQEVERIKSLASKQR